MIEKYKVLDMSLFYSSIPEEQMYFVLSSESCNSEKVTQKIKVAKRRFISLEYEENEIVQVLIKDKESGTYESNVNNLVVVQPQHVYMAMNR